MEREVSRPIIFWGIAAVGVGAALWFSTAQGAAQSRAARPSRASSQTARPAARLEPAIRIRDAAPSAPGAFERYGPLIRRNPFAPNLPPRLDAAGDSGGGSTFVGPPLPPNFVIPKPPAPAAASPPAPPDPFKDLVYTGTVTIGDVTYAVVEDKTTKRGEYLGLEQTLQGGTVIGITQGTLLILINGQTRSLHKSTAFNATPLNAPAATAPAGAAAPGAAGKPGAPAGPGAPGAPVAPPAPGTSSGPQPPAGLAAPVVTPAGVVSEIMLLSK